MFKLPRDVLTAMQGKPLPGVVVRASEKAASGELRAGEELLRQSLAQNLLQDDAAARSAFSLLLHLLVLQERREEIAAVFRADWSPVREEADEAFDRMYAAAVAATQSSPLPLRRRPRFQSLVRLLVETRGIAGEVAECGCYQGLSSHLICQTLAAESPSFDGAGFHIFDSFAGLSDPMPEDAVPDEHPEAERLNYLTQAGAFAAPLERVQRHLACFPAIAYHRGWIPLSFDGLPERRYRFVHLDVDLYDPTRDSLEYFQARLAPGGMIVSDDYGWPGARRAIEEFCAERALAFAVTDFEQAVVRI